MVIDFIALMQAAGSYPLPPSTGQYFNYPGPRYHDGLLYGESLVEEGDKTYGKPSRGTSTHLLLALHFLNHNIGALSHEVKSFPII